MKKRAQKTFGKAVYLRGLIEFSNFCKNDCLYCGIRRSNTHASRYRLTPEEILEISQFARSLPGVKQHHLLPYHRLGSDKYEGLGRDYLMSHIEPPTVEKMNELLLKVAKGDIEARNKILIPTYCWMLEEKAYEIIEFLRKERLNRNIVIVDNSINYCINNTEIPLSFAFLLKSYIEGIEPYKDSMKDVINEERILVGSKERIVKKNAIVSNKIANIYTGQQRLIDF